MKQYQAGQGNKNMRICVSNSVNVPLRACRLGRPVPRLSGQGSFVSGQCSDKPLELGSCRPILSHKTIVSPWVSRYCECSSCNGSVTDRRTLIISEWRQTKYYAASRRMGLVGDALWRSNALLKRGLSQSTSCCVNSGNSFCTSDHVFWPSTRLLIAAHILSSSDRTCFVLSRSLRV